MKRIIMITFILLALFCHSSQDGNTRQQGVCGPRNLKLNLYDRRVQVTWDDDPSCSAVKDELTYELLLRFGETVHHEVVTVNGSSHSWNWTSHVAFECSPISVSLGVQYENRTSPGGPEQTLPGNDSRSPEVYPRDRVFAVGSRATFSCVLPAGGSLIHMNVTGYTRSEVNVTQTNNQTHSLSVVLNRPSTQSGTDVICLARVQDKYKENGATAFIGYPPADKDLQCETRDLDSVVCHWTVGRNTNLRQSTEYQLVGRACARALQGKCSQEVNVSTCEGTWTLVAQNELGWVELTDRADLMKRVHMLAPESVSASVSQRGASLRWSWKLQRYRHVDITCQVNLSHAGSHELTQRSGVGLDFALLKNLNPNWSYEATVRCRTTQHAWKWGSWSSALLFHTEEDVPDALDVWMKTKDNEVLIIWKIPTEDQSHGPVLDYTVTWSKVTDTQQDNKTVSHNKLTLSLDTTQQYVVNVTARNVKGSSPPSTIFTPSAPSVGLYNSSRVNAPRIIGSDGGFRLSWSPSPAASCGYIVDWCPTSDPSMVEWLKVDQTNITIFSRRLEDGQRYSVSVSACTRAAPLLLETREGYVAEKWIPDNLFVKTLTWKQKVSDVEVSWGQINLTEQTAFIQGYVLSWCDHDTYCNVSTDDPTATSLTASDLRNSAYTFTLRARTALGDCGSTSITVITNSLTGVLIDTAFISLAAVFGLLLLVTVVCYRQRACIKQKVYPPIPRPLLTATWLKSTGEPSLYVDQCPSEVDIMDSLQLLPKPGAQVTQTLQSYYNQPPPNLIAPPRPLPSPPGAPSSPLRGLFPNPSYNLMMQTEDQPEGHTNEYRTQTLTAADEESESHMTCVFTYITLPRPASHQLT